MQFDLATYLRLTPEFGGTRFGPFEGLEIRLGSNSDRCHIVLPESLGVRAEHAKVVRQGPDNLILAPAERAAAVFLWKAGARRPTQLSSQTAVRSGDGFSLVTPDGPRFTIEIDELPEEIKAQRESRGGVATGRNRLSAGSMGKELKRQAWTKVLVMGPAQFAQRAWTYIASGAIWQPRNILMFMGIASGWVMGGAMTCRSFSLKKSLTSAQSYSSSCKQSLDTCEGRSDEGDMSFPEYAGAITRMTVLQEALDADKALQSAVRERAANAFNDKSRWENLYMNQGSQAKMFASWRDTVVDKSGLDDETKALAVWLAARPDYPRRTHSELRTPLRQGMDSDGVEVCQRGPMLMSYRHATNLGLTSYPDFYIARGGADMSETDRGDRLRDLVPPRLFEALPDPLVSDFAELGSRAGCVYTAEVSDQRDSLTQVRRALDRHIGPGSDYLPETTDKKRSVARIAKFWAAEIEEKGNYDDPESPIDFGARPVGQTLQEYGPNGQWVMDRTAETIAASIVVPCLGVLENPEGIGDLLPDDPPSLTSCVLLYWKLTKSDS